VPCWLALEGDMPHKWADTPDLSGCYDNHCNSVLLEG